MAKLLSPIPNERLVELVWYGPFLLREGNLIQHPLEPVPMPPDVPGLYVATGDHLLYGKQVLLYIGQTGRPVSQRIGEHEWLQDEWRLEIYVTDIQDSALRGEVEALLIYAHTPLNNSSRIYNPPDFTTPLRIWNQGRFWGLYPEVSSKHGWYQSSC